MKKKVTYESIDLNYETGEIMRQRRTFKAENEPAYVKLYIENEETQCQLSPLLIELLKHMSYANQKCTYGGQIIYITGKMKQNVAKMLNMSLGRLSNSLTDMIKSGLLKIVDRGVYQVNPYIIGKGEWKDIEALRKLYKEG